MKPALSYRLFPIHFVRHSIVEPNDSSTVVAATAAAAATALLHGTSDAAVTSNNSTDIVAITEGVLKVFTAVMAGLSLTYYVLRYTFSTGATVASHIFNTIRSPGQWALGHAYHLALKKPLYYVSSTVNLFYPIIVFCIAAGVCGVIIGSFAGFVAEAVSSIVISATWGSDTAQKVIKEAVEDGQFDERNLPPSDDYLDDTFNEDREEPVGRRGGMKILTDYDTTEDEDNSINGNGVPLFNSSRWNRRGSSGADSIRQKWGLTKKEKVDDGEEDIYSHDNPQRARPHLSRTKYSEQEDASTSTSNNLSASLKGFLKRRISNKHRSPSPPPFSKSRRMQLSSTVPNLSASHTKHQQQQKQGWGWD